MVGAAGLILGAELLVRGASRLATAAGIEPLVVGLTVVAFGTSAPELAVTVGAAWSGQAEMALGNVVGSNILNVLFILGASAAIAPLLVSHDLVRLDVPVMIGASLLVLVLALDGRIGRGDGLGLVVAGVAYTLYLLHRGRQGGHTSPGRGETGAGDGTRRGPGAGLPGPAPWALDLVAIGAGLVLLAFGARWLVRAAVDVAAALGVSELVVGLTIVAAGTSLPEMATSILASIRGQRDIAVGNVVGSNIFNLLAVLGLGSALAPDGIAVTAGALTFDLPIMIGVALATLPIVFTGYIIARWEGFVFLGYYAAYTAFLVGHAADHDVADAIGAAILYFVLPLTAITLVALAFRALRSGGHRHG